jgi:hypothetical protein
MGALYRSGPATSSGDLRGIENLIAGSALLATLGENHLLKNQ